jgi:redox-regulated HSP33 family molecular chaperone
MAYERRINETGLFPNTAHPDKSDYNGQIEVECAFCGKSYRMRHIPSSIHGIEN